MTKDPMRLIKAGLITAQDVDRFSPDQLDDLHEILDVRGRNDSRVRSAIQIDDQSRRDQLGRHGLSQGEAEDWEIAQRKRRDGQP